MADTRTLAPVLARRAAEHPERPLVIGVPRRDSAALVPAPTRAPAVSRAELVPDCPARIEAGLSVQAGRFTDPRARERGIAGRRTESILRAGRQLYSRELRDQQRAAGSAGTTGGKARPVARHTMVDHTIPDLDRSSDAFPMTSSGKAGRRELERRHALDSTVTSGA